MVQNLNQIINEYSEELFADLGPAAIPEEKKAEIFARLEDHLHKLILDTLVPLVSFEEIAKIKLALEEEDYRKLEKILKRFPHDRANLQERIHSEFKNLTLTIAEELKNAAREEIAAGGANGTATA
jgi:hypothetical protein